MIPDEFDDEGFLAPGDHEATFQQLRASILVRGPRPVPPNWDGPWRSMLVDNLEIMVGQLWRVGIDEVFVDGSFAEDKSHPNDIDGYFVCDRDFLASGDLERALNRLDRHKIWTWSPRSRRPYRGDKAQLPMWHQYRVELYPHYGQISGILDEFGNQLEFPAAFRKSRRGHRQRGIVRLVRENPS